MIITITVKLMKFMKILKEHRSQKQSRMIANKNTNIYIIAILNWFEILDVQIKLKEILNSIITLVPRIINEISYV